MTQEIKMRRILPLLIGIAIALPLFGQEILRNEEIVKLSKAGLSIDTIAAKIRTSDNAFRTDSDSLIELVKAGVPDDIIRVMILESDDEEPVTMRMPLDYKADDQEETDDEESDEEEADDEEAERSVRTGESRRFDIAVHRSRYARCPGELEISAEGVRSSRCRGLDFSLRWEEISGACFSYGFNGVAVLKSRGRSYTVSTETPMRMREIRDAIAGFAPNLVDDEECD